MSSSPTTTDGVPNGPGLMLREDVLEPMGLSVAEFAERLRLPEHAVRPLLDETAPVTPEIDVRLSRFLGTSEGYFLRYQAARDVRLARARLADELALIEPAKRVTGKGDHAPR